MQIDIDNSAGFCFGVQRAIDKANELLNQGVELYCLGEIVHNHEEENRLNELGMVTITHSETVKLSEKTVLLRSHGEPPSTYKKLNANKNLIIDATCPVVLKLQQRVKQSFETLTKENGQLVIFGKHGHPEVVGLAGQTNNRAIVISQSSDLNQLDFNRPIEIYSQTTMSVEAFSIMVEEIKNKATNKLKVHDTICRQVASRVPRIRDFASKHDVILFVSGKKSSNGKFLFEVCKSKNPNSYFISSPNEVNFAWLTENNRIGISGATSTPLWLMEQVKAHLTSNLNQTENR